MSAVPYAYTDPQDHHLTIEPAPSGRHLAVHAEDLAIGGDVASVWLPLEQALALGRALDAGAAFEFTDHTGDALAAALADDWTPIEVTRAADDDEKSVTVRVVLLSARLPELRAALAALSAEETPSVAMSARRPIFNHLVAPLAGGPVTHEQAKAMLDAYRDEARAVRLPARRVYLDCEFLPWMTSTAGLVSIGLTDHEGRDYYAVNAEMDYAEVQANPFQREHVWPQLPRTATLALDRDHPDVKPLEQIREELTAYFDTGTETGLYAYYGASDLMRVHSLWRHDWAVMPTSVPRWLDDLKALTVRAGNPQMPRQEKGEHHALEDARHNRAMHDVLIALGRG